MVGNVYLLKKKNNATIVNKEKVRLYIESGRFIVGQIEFAKAFGEKKPRSSTNETTKVWLGSWWFDS